MDTRGFVHRGKATGFRDLGAMDVDALCARVRALSEEEWRHHDAAKPNRFDSLGGTQHLVMTFVRQVSTPVDWYALPAWDEWGALVQPLLDEAARRLGYAQAEFPRVMLARLPAGAEITAHRDGGRFPAFAHKLHIALETNPHVEFYVDPEWRHIERGRLVEVNNNLTHAVRNDGRTPRVHLVFECFESPLDLQAHDCVGARTA